MLPIYLFTKPVFWILPWILQAIGYFLVLKKMGLKKYTAIIPVFAEEQLATKLFKRRRAFWRPFVLSLIFALTACYLGPHQGFGLILMFAVCVIYGIFLILLYYRLAKSFGRGAIFTILLILFPMILLIVLGLNKNAQFTAPIFKPDKERSKAARIFRHIAFAVISVLEILVIVGGAGYFAIQQHPPGILVNSNLQDVYDETEDITGTGKVVSREDALGKNASEISNMKASRDYFYPDHSNDKSVVVMAYVIGSNLEDGNGLATANIHQMIEATKKGSGLKFIVEAGGSKRWFTSGIDDSSYGRYEISDGKITLIKKLPSDTSMSNPDTLADFISWTKETYPADRNMLVLWDHGGGVCSGYGQDSVNSGKSKLGTISVSEIAKAIKSADIKFDMIGFDACLMQDIEIAKALEPYADYYLASEETESGYGWFYTSAFGKLAENPGMSSADFGREMIACYDPYNKATDAEAGGVSCTLSFVDLPMAASAYDQLSTLFQKIAAEIPDSTASYADVAASANKSYAFYADIQIDLVDFLKNLDKSDYDGTICSHKDKVALIQAVQASVLYRNGGSAKGIYGISLAFPYKKIEEYGDTTKQLKALSLKNEKKAFDEVFSIIAVKQNAQKKSASSNPFINSMLSIFASDSDYTNESWYIKGYEDYDDTKAYTNIPLTKTDAGYEIELPKKAWKIIADCQTAMYQLTDKDTDGYVKGSYMRYLGSDYIAGDDADGHPMIDVDGTWAYIGDQLVCYEAEPYEETDDGIVYSGTVKARLNGRQNILLHVEWDPVKDENEEPTVSHVVGYSLANDENIPDTKGLMDLKAGEYLQFMFDYYDADGNLIKTKAVGDKVYVSNQGRLSVEYKPFQSCTIKFGGKLTDVYQRIMTTELIEQKID